MNFLIHKIAINWNICDIYLTLNSWIHNWSKRDQDWQRSKITWFQETYWSRNISDRVRSLCSYLHGRWTFHPPPSWGLVQRYKLSKMLAYSIQIKFLGNFSNFNIICWYQEKHRHDPVDDSKFFSAPKVLPIFPIYTFLSWHSSWWESLQISSFSAKASSEFSYSETLRQTPYFIIQCYFVSCGWAFEPLPLLQSSSKLCMLTAVWKREIFNVIF